MSRDRAYLLWLRPSIVWKYKAEEAFELRTFQVPNLTVPKYYVESNLNIYSWSQRLSTKVFPESNMADLFHKTTAQ